MIVFLFQSGQWKQKINEDEGSISELAQGQSESVNFYVRDAKSSFMKRNDTCMPISYPRYAPVSFVHCYLSEKRKLTIPTAPPET